MTLGASEVVVLLRRHGIEPSRALGQNFVVDPNTVRRIARLAGVGPGDKVVEIGAGTGSLTLALLETGAEVTAVEMDRRLLPVLDEVLAGCSVRVVHADATDADWTALLPGRGWVLVANLPYNIATGLVADLLRDVPAVERMLVMVQREVAERLVAGPGDHARGSVSVRIELRAERRIAASVPRTVFHPRPDVDSALVALRRRPHPDAAGADLAAVDRLCAAAFNQRRKMLRRSLAGRIPPGCFERAGVDPTARPADLAVRDWVALVDGARDGAAPCA